MHFGLLSSSKISGYPILRADRPYPLAANVSLAAPACHEDLFFFKDWVIDIKRDAILQDYVH